MLLNVSGRYYGCRVMGSDVTWLIVKGAVIHDEPLQFCMPLSAFKAETPCNFIVVSNMRLISRSEIVNKLSSEPTTHLLIKQEI